MGERDGSAIFSADRRYRYRLTRKIEGGSGAVTFVMLNPSIADESQDDPTIRKCRGFAKRWGYGTMHAVNLSPYRATHPANLYKALPEPRRIRRQNTSIVLETASESELIVLAYGNPAERLVKTKGTRGRVRRMTRLLTESGNGLHCLGITNSGYPRHPVRIAYDTPLEVYEPRHSFGN